MLVWGGGGEFNSHKTEYRASSRSLKSYCATSNMVIDFYSFEQMKHSTIEDIRSTKTFLRSTQNSASVGFWYSVNQLESVKIYNYAYLSSKCTSILCTFCI